MKTRTVVLSILLGGGFLFILCIVACGGLFYSLYKNTDKEISPKIDSLFAAIDNNTFVDTYANETTPAFQQVLSKEKYEQIGRSIKNRLGHLQSKSLVSWNSAQFNMESTINVVYSAKFEKGQGTIQAGFVKSNGQWQLQNFRVNSPEFLNDMASASCPHCGKPCSTEAKFCPSCGKEMVATDNQSDGKNPDSDHFETK
jgi:hypothetical protein